MTTPTPPTGPPGPPPGPAASRRGPALAVIALGVVVIGIIAAVAVTRDDTTTTTTPLVTTSTTTVTTTTPASTAPSTSAPPGDELLVGPETDDIARATVVIVQFDAAGDPVCTGSGTIVDAGGLILTNAHVVARDEVCDYETLTVGLTHDPDVPAEPEYVVEVVAFDPVLDLAAVQIVSDLDGNPVDTAFPHVAIGDSDTVQLGDELRLLGYPGIGGHTITLTRGVVSGFVAEQNVDPNRAWIKTDATVSGGNSGGTAVNADGELIGVPTLAGSGPDTDIVDCRVVQDTNGDGRVDEHDTCIPIGGFINGIRPVNLAADVLATARLGQPVAHDQIQPTEPGPVSVDDLVITDLVFADGVTPDNRPTRIVPALPSGVDRVCAFWRYDGFTDGLVYDAVWRIDGVLAEEASFLGDTWHGGTTGSWWVCIIDETGLVDGLYEFEFTVDGQIIATDAIWVGGDRRPVTLTLANASDQLVCFVQLAPSDAANWGPDELGPDEVVEPGTSRSFPLVSGFWDMALSDCDGKRLDEIFGIDVGADATVTYTG